MRIRMSDVLNGKHTWKEYDNQKIESRKAFKAAMKKVKRFCDKKFVFNMA